MNKFTKFVSIVGLCVFSSLAWSDGPKFDLKTNTFEVPCVKVINEDETGTYYDATFERRGSSHNFLLILADEALEPTACQDVDLFATFRKKGDDDDEPKIYAECEVYKDADGNILRSEIEVKGKNLDSDVDYTAVITSGGDLVASTLKTPNIDGKVEFEFDSNQEKIDEGATQIDAEFIVDTLISADIRDATDTIIVSVTDIACEVEVEGAEVESAEVDED